MAKQSPIKNAPPLAAPAQPPPALTPPSAPAAVEKPNRVTSTFEVKAPAVLSVRVLPSAVFINDGRRNVRLPTKTGRVLVTVELL